jgi:hypothetical protein
LQQIINKYRAGNGLISYADFCGNIDTVFSDTCNPIEVIENSKSTASFSDEERAILTSLLNAIQT